MPGKERNQPIGEVDCGHRSCDLKAKLYKYRKQAQQDGKSRFAGKLYAICERGHRCEDQEYLLDKGKVWGASKNDAVTASDGVKAGKSSPVKSPATTPSPPVRKAAKAAPTPSAPTQQAKKRFGFWEW